jgi:uncharacterized membrane protein
MTKVEQSIDIDLPIQPAYNQWTQFEDFPRFMEGVEEVRQVTDTRLHWVVNIAGVRREFDAEVTEQIPDERIAWKSIDGPKHAGVVTFHRLSDNKTRVMLQLEFEPSDFVEKVGSALGFVGHRARKDLERFKEFIESRGAPTGAWRGEVDQTSTR